MRTLPTGVPTRFNSAAPMAAGVAALMFAVNGDLDPEAVVRVMCKNGTGPTELVSGNLSRACSPLWTHRCWLKRSPGRKSTFGMMTLKLETTDQGERWDDGGSNGSNWNTDPAIDLPLAAPADGIFSTDPQCRRGEVPHFADQVECEDQANRGNYSVSLRGTSYAATMAAGIAALMLAVDDSLTPAQIERLLCITARDLPNWSVNSTPEPPPTCGLVNAGAAVELASLRYLFDDDFETGDTGRWNNSVP